ncbi:PREDICTED: growth arrest-specific protein 7-like [Branchiostoma belcheri]|uniref:Growth arrest-specific protein 7-like n=1 Tax=Branchiostoma belcheri TaxID=7741 RepID=A0A6P4YDR4_BRABE|nr:PREDICTED: growth arrest-specific protein 7-like [Branchiostoma belcheri]
MEAEGSLCRALYDFVPEPGEQGLAFEAGAWVRVLQTAEDGWWEGERDGGVRGWFPATYVELVDESQTEIQYDDSQPIRSPSPGQPQEPLPPGWQVFMSPDGRPYYVNRQTSETSWDAPVMPGSPLPVTPTTPTKKQGYDVIETDGGQKTPEKSPDHEDKILQSPKKVLNNSTPSSAKLSKDAPKTDSTPNIKSPETKSTDQNNVVNHLTFPPSSSASDQKLLKPGEYSYCDYFWADKGNLPGFHVLLEKQLQGKQMTKEMAEYFTERAAAEEAYARTLTRLSQNLLASQEEGTLGDTWSEVKKSIAQEAEVHHRFSVKVQDEIVKPLATFRETFKKDMKKTVRNAQTFEKKLRTTEQHVADHRKQIQQKYQGINKAKAALAERQKELDQKLQKHKTEDELKKARRKSTAAGDNLLKSVEQYNISQSKWFEEMVSSTLELERLEGERVQMVKEQLNKYISLRKDVDKERGKVLCSIEDKIADISPDKDRERFVKAHGTGQVRTVDYKLA